jgi:hypothetical protein
MSFTSHISIINITPTTVSAGGTITLTFDPPAEIDFPFTVSAFLTKDYNNNNSFNITLPSNQMEAVSNTNTEVTFLIPSHMTPGVYYTFIVNTFWENSVISSRTWGPSYAINII